MNPSPFASPWHLPWHMMGIVNVTPDSFSDGGRFLAAENAIAHGRRLLAEGAAILDIGGESSRPGAAPVTPEEECRRILPVIEALAPGAPFLSIDTRNLETMERALAAGAGIINDITAFRDNPEGLELAAEKGAFVCLMHMRGLPETMQDAPEYSDVVEEVCAFLSARIEAAVKSGIPEQKVIADPGIGFGKTLAHNLALLRDIGRFHALGVPLMLGASRKSFIAGICPDTPPDERLPGSLAASALALEQGVQLYRVHDVRETAQALAVAGALCRIS